VETNVRTNDAEAAPPSPAPEAPAEQSHPLGRPPEGLPAYDRDVPSRVTDTSGVELEVIDLANKSDRKRFLGMVEPIYAGDPNFIMPLWFERMEFLDTKKNRALSQLEPRVLLAKVGGKVVGRMTAHIDHAYNRYHDTNAGWFGFFECIDDPKVAHALLADGCDWLRGKGCTDVIGPMNFTTNHQCGLLVENFDRPAMIEMTYNPPYYEALLTSFGFAKAKDLLAWWIDISAGLDNPKIARINRIATRVKKRSGVTLRHANMKEFDLEVERLFTIYNEAWQKNWGFVPVGREEFEAIAKSLKPVIKEQLVLFVEVDGEQVGFSVTLPNLNKAMPKDGKLLPFGWAKLLFGLNKIREGRLMVLGVAPKYRKRGLEALLFIETTMQAKALGYSGGEIGWTLEDNDLINLAIKSMDGQLDRRYRLLGMAL